MTFLVKDGTRQAKNHKSNQSRGPNEVDFLATNSH